MTEADDDVPPKGLIAGKYRLTNLLGRGGMGSVWAGVHESLGTRVAVKFIDSEHAQSDEVRQRFVNEARAAARLRSKHVVQVYDQGVGDDGRPYIVMEHLKGEALEQLLDREGKLHPLETARIVLHVCRALARAHEAGIVHRDLKPENVFLVHDDEDDTVVAKVVDFGIAKITDASGPGTSSTRTGAVLGTPQYMSPEQARGLRTVDRRTDLWSLAVIVYRALVGVMPFKGEAVGDLLVNVCTQDPPVPSSIAPEVPAGFDDWVRRALAREPERRFQTAAELNDSFAALAGFESRLGSAPSGRDVAPAEPIARGAVTASPLAATPVPFPPKRRSPVPLLALLFVGVTAVAVVGARAVLRGGTTVSPEGSAALGRTNPLPAPPATAAALTSVPAVTPVTSAIPAPDTGAESAPSDDPSDGRKRPRPRPAAAAHVAPPKKEKPAPDPVSPKPSRPGDVLGY